MTNHDGPYAVLVSILLVKRNPQFFQYGFNLLHRFVYLRMLNRASADVHNRMAVRFIESRDHLMAFPFQLQLRFVPVIPWVLHAENRLKLNSLPSRIPAERLAHDIRLGLQLALIGDMLNLASAADAEYRQGGSIRKRERFSTSTSWALINLGCTSFTSALTTSLVIAPSINTALRR